MQANRRRDTKPELALRRALLARGLRYREIWADSPDMPGLKVDLSPIVDSGLALCD